MSVPESSPFALDSVDRILEDWAGQRLGLDFSPVGIIARLARVRAHLDAALLEVFDAHDLTAADFAVLVTLRRAGRPYQLAQRALMAQLELTSGTVSVRLTRLAGKGLITREPSPHDGRGIVVALTERGLEMFDRVAPTHLANEDRLLSSLSPAEQTQLADLLRRMLVGFEHPRTTLPAGFTVAPAHEARRMRTAVGLSDTPGLLVTSVDPDTAADRSGLLEGDLLIRVDGHELRSCVTLAAHARSGKNTALDLLRGDKRRSVVLDG